MSQMKNSQHSIKAIVFDLDGVYFNKGKAEFLSSLTRYGVEEASAKSVFLTSQQMADYKLGKINDDEFWAWAESQWNTGLSSHELIELMLDGYAIDERVMQLVQTVRRKGYKTLICSNNFPARIQGLKRKFGFLQQFDTAVFSYQVHAAKPSTEIFAELLRRSGCQPQEIVYADDKSTALTGAKDLGINTLVYIDFEKYCNNLQAMGVVVS
ncbi:HAD family hydrolase [Candidatus Nanosynbacter featherlites]|uniref:HAD family hydrolase n=1 Tax=Candidatus Nanosynbacter featherlites TaxID=2572088 RepID=A0A4P9A3L5_9BACT|nr:HAD-IA family hydrolase [Candidatus Nanosynbacter featherlites]QCT42392.1 HAD family hydrolase [Candidatus Nanosynbacter featherlites]